MGNNPQMGVGSSFLSRAPTLTQSAIAFGVGRSFSASVRDKMWVAANEIRRRNDKGRKEPRRGSILDERRIEINKEYPEVVSGITERTRADSYRLRPLPTGRQASTSSGQAATHCSKMKRNLNGASQRKMSKESKAGNKIINIQF